MNKKQQNSGYQSSINFPGGRTGVLLIHGLGGAPMELKLLAQGLAREGYTVKCPVVPGMTLGTDVLGLSKWEDWFAKVEEAHDELMETCDTVLVGGLSVGSLLGLRLAAMRPDTVQGVMLFAPTLWPNGWAVPWYFNFFRIILQKSLARQFSFKQPEPFGFKDERIRNFMVDSFRGENRTENDMFRKRGSMLMELRRMAGTVKRQLKSVKQPTLIFHPRHDDQSDLCNSLTIMRKISGPAEAVVLNDSYHMVTLDRQRNLVVERSLEFVSRLLGERRVEERRVANKQRGGSTVRKGKRLRKGVAANGGMAAE